jgi:hypothetical protein
MTTTMRQRLLLVAGWLVAAIGSGIVASGAVAIAGGQVLDRAQRPITAAEVAALPVVTVESPDTVEPHASGGLVPNAGDSPDDSGVEEPGGSGSTGSRGSSASKSDDAPPDPFSVTTEVARIETNEGGRASFALADHQLILLWATPTQGYVVQRRTSEADRVTLSFTSNRNVWLIVAEIRDGDMLVQSQRVPLT